MSENIVLIACGSFNPPTPMHFRMFEIARDHFHVTKTGNVVGGIVSPVHDTYKKPNVELAIAKHRCKMIELSLSSSKWIHLSDWEIQQDSWTPTSNVLQYHQNHLNSMLRDTSGFEWENAPSWAPSNVNNLRGQQIQMKLLCGADLLESFANRNLWHDSQLETILKEHGIVVIARSGSNPQKFIFQSDIMFENQNKITIIENWVPNEISSTLARLHIRRDLSLKYLLNDEVIEYIYENELYRSNTKREANPKQLKTNVTLLESQKPKSVVIDIKSEISDEFDMDETDSSQTKKNKLHRNIRKCSSNKREYCLRDPKTKNRSQVKSRLLRTKSKITHRMIAIQIESDSHRYIYFHASRSS